MLRRTVLAVAIPQILTKRIVNAKIRIRYGSWAERQPGGAVKIWVAIADVDAVIHRRRTLSTRGAMLFTPAMTAQYDSTLRRIAAAPVQLREATAQRETDAKARLPAVTDGTRLRK